MGSRMKPGIIVSYAVDIFWYNRQGTTHRDGDKPAVIYADGQVEYYQNGVLHRDNDKPAVIWTNGCGQYYKNGKHYYH